MRINKYLALQKHSTRRGADELIIKKQVFINGRLAVLGDKVKETDKVDVRFRGKMPTYVYLAYNKPRGQITSDIHIEGVSPIGRLDKDSHGLIILSNDGRITDALLNPNSAHEKEYVVMVKEKLRNNFKEKMEAGVQIEDEKTRPCKVKILNEKAFSVLLTEGKKHQIRRMCSALFAEVDDLKRVRIMNITLDKLGDGQYREITGDELDDFLKSLGM